MYYQESFANKRRQTLFNLYAFTYQDSVQKEIPIGGLDSERLDGEYQIPTLIIGKR
jgi:hypothetical protein